MLLFLLFLCLSVAVAAAGCPQFGQNFASGSSFAPQCLQKFAISTPHYGLTSSKEPLIPSGQLIVPKAYI